MKRLWSDGLFRGILMLWLVLGVGSIIWLFLMGEPSVWHVMAVAWGVVVIFVLWFRLGPPHESRGRLFR